MRFYQEWKGIIWEFNSVGEFLLHIVCRIIGGIIGFGILYLIILNKFSTKLISVTLPLYPE